MKRIVRYAHRGARGLETATGRPGQKFEDLRRPALSHTLGAAYPRHAVARSVRSQGSGTARQEQAKGGGRIPRVMAHVLIVDDTEIVRKALELALKRMGHEIESASSALVALELARSRPPDLALLDVCMPVMDGVTLLGEMHIALGDRCPKVLFISAMPPEELHPSRVLPRVAGFVKKPFLLEDLSRAVASALAS